MHMSDLTFSTTENGYMAVAEDNTRVSVTLSKEIHDRIVELSKREHRSVSAQIAYEVFLSLEARDAERRVKERR